MFRAISESDEDDDVTQSRRSLPRRAKQATTRAKRAKRRRREADADAATGFQEVSASKRQRTLFEGPQAMRVRASLRAATKAKTIRRVTVRDSDEENSDGHASGEGSGDLWQDPAAERLRRARDVLHASYRPEHNIPCRDNHWADIWRFCQGALRQRQGRAMYISGQPGTGKTLTLSRLPVAVDRYNRRRQRATEVVQINCMGVGASKNTNRIYVELWAALEASAGEVVPAGEAIQHLRNHLVCEEGQDTREMVIVMLDEIDQLRTRDQSVLYRLFEWAYLPGSRLVLLGIANALDLTERLPWLKRKDICPRRLEFRPYTQSQIRTILFDRLQPVLNATDSPQGEDAPAPPAPPPLFAHRCLELVARKVHAVSGDLRTALEVCRSALQRALAAHEPTVSLPMVSAVLNETLNAHDALVEMQGLPVHQMVVICALALLTPPGEAGYGVPHDHLEKQYHTCCSQLRLVQRHTASHLCRDLETKGLIEIRENTRPPSRAHSRNGRSDSPFQFADKRKEIALCSYVMTVTHADVHEALEDKPTYIQLRRAARPHRQSGYGQEDQEHELAEDFTVW